MPEKPLRALVEVHRQEIRALVARHGGRSASVFGSVARGDERLGSDIDFLVELEPGVRPVEILAVGAELEDLLGVKVDVCSLSDLRGKSPVQVLAEAVPL